MSCVDVVVVTYRNEQSIETCLRSAFAIPQVDRVLVVDHGADACAELAASLGAEVIVDAANPGFGAGQNRGVGMTGAPYVLLLNPDAVMVPEAVAGAIDLLEGDPEIAAIQGVVRSRSDGTVERSQGLELGPIHLLGRAMSARRLGAYRIGRALGRRINLLADHVAREPSTVVEVEYLAATALLVRRSAFDDVDGFDSGYFLYGEDIDLCRRLRRRGWRLVALPGRWAVHENGASSASSPERELQWWRGTMRFAARWWTTRAWLGALGAAALRTAQLTAMALLHRRVGVRDPFRMLIQEPMRDRRLRHVSPAVPSVASSVPG